MLAPTHSVFGMFMTLIILAVFGVQMSLHWSILLVAVLGALMPDIDIPKSFIGKIFWFISIPLERKFGHRTITHSLLGWAIATIIFSVIMLASSFLIPSSHQLVIRWIASFAISYLSHIILDMINPRGVPLFWPDPGRDVFPKNPKFRPRSGSKAELVIFGTLIVLFFAVAMPISKYGVASSLRWLLANPASAIQEFKNLQTHSYLDFQGLFRESREPVSGKAEILNVENSRLIILFNNKVYSLSDELAADITAHHVRVHKTTSPIQIEQHQFQKQPREALIKQVPAGALISGIVDLPQHAQLKTTLENSQYKTIEQNGGQLILKYANPADLEKLVFDDSYELEYQQDLVQLKIIQSQARKTKAELYQLQHPYSDLTPLGQKLLADVEGVNAAQDREQIFKLKTTLEEQYLRIAEVQSRINAKKLVFSGEVFVRKSATETQKAQALGNENFY
jgi:inner membrane protein